ncbi:Homeobox domain-containing protein/START domain-containing protein [Cephalotus follicularis]|uniref:Homeobox domain-containing protein/START domain-containing protein n=1 Tax=Cephalotus follicularis TaxID=3775 RepID=A0A1Q3BWX7_CEPFO|nr:Homeobox domain-containing protein/START domain-containing protein [Cephalotus follicularis]
MLSGTTTQPPSLFTQSIISKSMKSTHALSIFIRSKMDGHGGMGLLEEHFDPNVIGRIREDEYESRSGSDNLDGGSGDELEANEEGPPRKKKYHRHTPNQIQELENFFKECPHPDEKQRLELSRRLGLESKQIKFWFQNRRTQMKTQLERHENILLRQENEKLQAENDFLKQAMRSPACTTCGGQAIPGDISYEQHQLRIENARLKDELNRICALANKFLGKPLTSSPSPISPTCLNSNLELAVGRNGFGGVSTAATTLPMGLDFGDGAIMPMMKPMMGVTSKDLQFDRSMLIDLALAAMDELFKMAHTDNPLWIKSFDEGKEVLNLEEYTRTFSPCIGMKPGGFVTEATRDTGLVIINSLALVETMMDTNRWAEMFPSVVARASTVDMVSTGTGGTKNSALQVMHAEFQLLSPLVPVRQVKFLRFCKQHAEGVWAVVDVSIDINQAGSNAHRVTCRRLPSGFVVQDMPNGYSKVIWVEHSEYDESSVHHLYRPLLSSGMGFGAHRWISALQRQCECSAILMSSSVAVDEHAAITPGGKKSMLKLAQRMTNNFCAGVCASSIRKWDQLRVENIGEDVRVLTRKSINDPGEPPGVVLSAATSVWMPVSRQRLFDFLQDERMRSAWDILSSGGPMHKMVHIAKGQGPGNCVSLLSANAISTNENNMLILQETWSDVSGSLVVYAPVDMPSMHIVMNGGDSAYVALLPSGFAILPPTNHGGPNNINRTIVKPEGEGNECGGCLLTVGFQILVNSLPTAKLNVESVETVNNLISCTIHKIKAALQLHSRT